MRTQHAAAPNPGSPPVGEVGESGDTSLSPALPSPATSPGEPKTVPTLRIKLPAVTEALRKKSQEEEEVDLSHLPPTPESEEELRRGLAKLYGGRVSRDVRSSLNYTETIRISEAARDPTLREELRDILSTCGFVLHSKEEQARLLEEAEARGRNQAMLSSPPSVPQGTSVPTEDPASPEGTSTDEQTPPLRCTTTYKPGEPHVVTIHTGGAWGIQLTACQISKL